MNNQPEQLLVPRWVRYEIAPFLHGRGLCFGTQGTPVVNPVSKTKDFNIIYGDADRVVSNVVVAEQDVFMRMFVPHSMDFVVLGPKAQKTREAISLAKKRLHPDGVLIMFDNQPFEGAQMINENWYLSCSHKDFNQNLTSAIAIVRYGAFGDLVMITPLIEYYAGLGKKVVVYTSPYAKSVLDNNPKIHKIFSQEKDAIAIQELGEYFAYLRPKYEKFIDLCESIEGSMLKLQSRKDFYMPKEWRNKTCDENYYRRTLRIGGVPEDEISSMPLICGHVYLSTSEKAWAQKEYTKLSQNGYFWLWGWAVHGTSHHKKYPLMQPFLLQYLAAHPRERVVLFGTPNEKQFEFEHPQVICRSGEYSPRQLIAMMSHIDGVVSPESFIANLAAAWDKPVVTLLSHSSRENLCATWKHDFALEPSTVVAPCFPCNQLHYTLESCPQREIIDLDTNEIVVAGPACTIGAISMETLAARMKEVVDAFGYKNTESITS